MAIVAVCTIGSPEPAPVRGWLLAPAGGTAWPLRRHTVLGRSPLRHLGPAPAGAHDLVIVDDADVSRAHLDLAVLVDGSVQARPLGPTSLVGSDGTERPLDGPTTIEDPTVVVAGSLTLHLLVSGPIASHEVVLRPQIASAKTT